MTEKPAEWGSGLPLHRVESLGERTRRTVNGEESDLEEYRQRMTRTWEAAQFATKHPSRDHATHYHAGPAGNGCYLCRQWIDVDHDNALKEAR